MALATKTPLEVAPVYKTTFTFIFTHNAILNILVKVSLSLLLKTLFKEQVDLNIQE